MHGATAIGIIDVIAADFVNAEHACVIAEDVAHDTGLVTQKIHLSVAVGNVQMSTPLRLAFREFLHQFLEGIKAFADLGIQLQGHVLTPTFYPL